MDLTELRERIDEIDRQIVGLYEKRMDVCFYLLPLCSGQRHKAMLNAQNLLSHNIVFMEKGVNQSDVNSTRFIVVTNQRIFRKDAKKVSICFEVPHKSGSLYHMLSHFIYNNLNMNKIESRPLEDRNWEYRFFIDFDGNLADGAVKNALRGLRELFTNRFVK